MTVLSATSSSTALTTQLRADGLTTRQTKLVESDLAAAGIDVGASGGTTTISPLARAAFDKRIEADVASGALSKDDAAAVRKTIDGLGGGTDAASGQGGTTKSGSTAASAGAVGGVKGGGGAGGGGGSQKTELSETVTIAGPVKTTVITYTDGSNDTTTSIATAADETRYGKAGVDGASIDKGALVDKLA